MYTRTLRNPNGAFRATKALLAKSGSCPKAVPLLLAAAAAVAVWEGGKYVYEKARG